MICRQRWQKCGRSLARSTRDAIEITERLEQAGADLVSITERIDTTTGIGRFFFTTMAALAQLERDQISERTTAALAHKRHKRQRVSGQIPFGYDLADDGVHLVANRPEQRTIRRVRRLRDSGMSSRNIIAELERRIRFTRRAVGDGIQRSFSICAIATASCLSECCRSPLEPLSL